MQTLYIFAAEPPLNKNKVQVMCLLITINYLHCIYTASIHTLSTQLSAAVDIPHNNSQCCLVVLWCVVLLRWLRGNPCRGCLGWAMLDWTCVHTI